MNLLLNIVIYSHLGYIKVIVNMGYYNLFKLFSFRIKFKYMYFFLNWNYIEENFRQNTKKLIALKIVFSFS